MPLCCLAVECNCLDVSMLTMCDALSVFFRQYLYSYFLSLISINIRTLYRAN